MFGRPTIRLALVLSLFCAPTLAQDTAPEKLPFLVERGLDLMFRQLPPEMRQYRQLLGEVPEYEAPQVLPNGDIIIRRKRAAPPATGPENTTDQIEL